MYQEICFSLYLYDTLFKWASASSSLPLVFLPSPPNPTGIFTLCTSRTNLFKALKRELHCVTFCHTFWITSFESWNLRLKLVPIALSLILTSFRIDTHTMSESLQYFNACSHKLLTLAIKWETGTISYPSGGGNTRTVSWVPTLL